MELGAATHPGYIRPGNEDGFFASREYAVFAVADGMGGHEFGEIACQLALDTIAAQVEHLGQAGPADLPVLLHDTIQAANIAVLSHATGTDAGHRMGTTLVVAVIRGNRLYFAHVGDSRLYLLRGHALTQLTHDHSVVQQMVDRGEITLDEAAVHPLRHTITRVVGGDDTIAPEIASHALAPGDQLLLCTDGLHGLVTYDDLQRMLTAPQSAQAKADALITAALNAGGPDNITAVVVGYHDPTPIRADVATRHRRLPLWQSITIVVLVVAILTAGYAISALSFPRFTLGISPDGTVCVYQRWPLLPMLATRQVQVTDLAPINAMDARTALAPYGTLEQGIPIRDVESGKALVSEATRALLATWYLEAKDAADRGDFTRARAIIEKARGLQADPGRLAELETLVTQGELAAARPKPTPTPKSATPPSPVKSNPR